MSSRARNRVAQKRRRLTALASRRMDLTRIDDVIAANRKCLRNADDPMYVSRYRERVLGEIAVLEERTR